MFQIVSQNSQFCLKKKSKKLLSIITVICSTALDGIITSIPIEVNLFSIFMKRLFIYNYLLLWLWCLRYFNSFSICPFYWRFDWTRDEKTKQTIDWCTSSFWQWSRHGEDALVTFLSIILANGSGWINGIWSACESDIGNEWMNK